MNDSVPEERRADNIRALRVGGFVGLLVLVLGALLLIGILVLG